MPSINQIVDVQITRQTAAVAQAGFGVTLIVGHTATSVFDSGELVKEYTAVADMLTDGFSSTSPEYLTAVRLMGQANKSQKFLVGVVTVGATERVYDYVGTLTSGTVTFTVNGTPVSQVFVTDQESTMDALAVALAANANIDSATWDDPEQTLTITSNVGLQTLVSTALGDFTSVTQTTSAGTSTWAAELAAISEENDSWYVVIPARYSDSDAIAAADFASSKNRILAITLYDADTLTTATTGLAHTFSAAEYDRVATYWHQTFGEPLAAGSMGERLPTVPGSGTFKFKKVSGAVVSDLSSTQVTNAKAKNVNLLLSFGTNAVVTEGVVASGEFIDTIIGTDWLTARISENVFARLINLPKIPYSDVGFSIVESAIREVLAAGIRNGIILDDEGLTVNVLRRSEISSNDRANRLLPDITFTANLAGAVHFVQIRGTVSV